MKRTPFLLLIIAAIMIPVIGCSDDDNNPEFVEYINPITNNPVNTIDWLMKKKEEAKDWFVLDPVTGTTPIYEQNGWQDIIWGAYIKSYTYEEQDYYEVRYGGLNMKGGLKFGTLNFQCDIYDSQGNVCYSIIGGDAGGSLPGYEHLSDFWNIATFKSLLWEYKLKY